MPGRPHTYGLLAEYDEAAELLEAARKVSAAGYSKTDAFSPFPIDGLAEAVGMRKNRVALATLLGGLFGGGLAYFMLYYINVIDYPMNVGGRPLHSWPSFIPITFEVTVLFAAFGALLGMLVLNRLPELYHPVFGGERFERATQDAFFLVVEAGDPLFEEGRTREFLRTTGSRNVSLVEEFTLPHREETLDDAGTKAAATRREEE